MKVCHKNKTWFFAEQFIVVENYPGYIKVTVILSKPSIYRKVKCHQHKMDFSAGSGEGMHAPWGVSKFFQFHAVFGKVWQNCMFAIPPRGNPGSVTEFAQYVFLNISGIIGLPSADRGGRGGRR